MIDKTEQHPGCSICGRGESCVCYTVNKMFAGVSGFEPVAEPAPPAKEEK